MKVLIAYDDSECARTALEDLKNAGLPAETEAVVLMVTENWSLIFEEQEKELPPEQRGEYPTPLEIKRIRERAHAEFAETEKLVKGVAGRLQTDFPSWEIRGEAMPGFAHWSVLEKAGEWKPDLIVVGSHGRNFVGRLVLGSSSLKILTESPCSVRVARLSPARTPDDDSPQRIVIGFDGSNDSMLAVESVAKRRWRQDSAVRLVSAVEPFLAITPGFEVDLRKIEESRNSAVRELEAAGLHVSTDVRVGEPKNILIEEAETWGADAIFIGARGHRLMERILLGSVSYAVAARADCSVEVVR